MFSTQQIGICYNFYKNRKIEIRINDFLCIYSEDLLSFYVVYDEQSCKIDKISISNNAIHLLLNHEILTIDTESPRILQLWHQLFTQTNMIKIDENETAFDMLIGHQGIENIRFYREIIENDYSFIDFIKVDDGYDVCTYQPFMRNKLQQLDFTTQHWALKFEDREHIDIHLNCSEFIYPILKHNLMTKYA